MPSFPGRFAVVTARKVSAINESRRSKHPQQNAAQYLAKTVKKPASSSSTGPPSNSHPRTTNLVFLTDTEYPGHGHSSRQTSAPETSDESGCDTQPQSICGQSQKQTPIGPSAIDNIKAEGKDAFEKQKLRTSNGHVNGNGRIPPQTTESNAMPEAPSMADKYSYQDSIDDEDCTSSLNTSKPKLRASTARRLGNLSDFSKKIGLHNPKLPQWNLQDRLAAYSVPHSQDHITNGFNLEYISSDYVLDLADFWDPFPDIDECELEDLEDHIATISETDCAWDAKYSLVVSRILDPFLQKYRGHSSSGWVEEELKTIFEEAAALPIPPIGDTRYFKADSVEHCHHDNECFCYFDASPDGGITGLPIDKDRKACLAFMHKIIVQFLIILASYEGYNRLDDDQMWMLYRGIQWMAPDHGEGEEGAGDYGSDEDDDDYHQRARYLEFDSFFRHLGDCEDDKTVPKLHYDFRKLVGILGRRALALGVCITGTGHLFVRKEPIHYWQLSELVQDYKEQLGENTQKYLKRNPKNNIDHPRYPNRVINTHTLEFEEDQMLFRKRYAILSHTWTQRGKEVTFDEANAVLGEAKLAAIEGKILKLQEKLNCIDKEELQNRSVVQSSIKALEDEKKAVHDRLRVPVRAPRRREDIQERPQSPREPPTPGNIRKTYSFRGTHFQGPGRTNSLNPKHDINPGNAKLLNAITAARSLGYTYIWIDSCCINKPNNTELLESISSMGDWYQNSQVCIVYLDDFQLQDKFDHTKVPKKLSKNRWASRGWTLQEIVISPRAIFFDRSWKEIARTEKQTPEGREALAKICGVPSNLLCVGKKPDVAASVILKHAGKRRTYKHEDRVYSLMGMLGVRMRADYGEGQAKAFSRLFEYIIRTTGDISIFNWTGSYSGSPITGRSMYCTDFDGFSRNHTANDLAKPASALSAITLDHFGLHARFDICEMEVIVEGDNKRTLDAVYHLEKTLEAGQHGTANTDCFCECEFIFRNKFRVNISVLCPLSSLRGVLEYATNKSPGRTVSWVMARFSGVADSNWFLCELKQDSQVENDGIFADLMRSTTMSSDSSARRQSIVDPGSLMQYLESSGLPGRRLATSEFPQDKLPQARKDRQFIRNVYMWVE